jgi:hypothetical protein
VLCRLCWVMNLFWILPTKPSSFLMSIMIVALLIIEANAVNGSSDAWQRSSFSEWGATKWTVPSSIADCCLI